MLAGASTARHVCSTIDLNRAVDARDVGDGRPTIQLPCEHICDEFIRFFAIASDSIRFNTPISISLALDDQRICDCSIVAFVKIKRIVIHVERYVVFHVHRAAEEFESVVVRRICLSILNNSSVAHTTKGDSVQFVAISNLIASVFDDKVL